MNHSELSQQYSALENSISAANEFDAKQNIEIRKQALISQFFRFGVVGILLISFLIILFTYSYLHSTELKRLSQEVHQQVTITAREESAQRGVDQQSAYDAMLSATRNHLPRSLGMKLFDTQGMSVASRGAQTDLPSEIAVNELTVLEPNTILSPHIFSGEMLLGLVTGNYPSTLLASLVPLQNKRTVLVLNIDNSVAFAERRESLLLLLVGLLLCLSLIFILLHTTFSKSIETIDELDVRLRQQISSLSDLLHINKSMQRSIRSASARAVELNEQFLRRTGADLHDGPAQMIGFSVMRLNQAIEKDESNLISPEFHAIKQALEQSLEEIRGISSGLVLPELESLSIEQCMNKVVLLHTSIHKIKVKEFYQNVEHEIPLPIKICAYRLVQEGLNNTQRHADAKQCRLTVRVKSNVLQIVLKDNGIGFRTSRLSNNGKHLGLMGLKDRIESLGGRLSIKSELGVGTSLKLILDLDQVG